MKALQSNDLQAVSAGHISSYFFLLELPHAFMGFKEFVNYVVGLSINGCQQVEDDDYFTQFLCKPFN